MDQASRGSRGGYSGRGGKRDGYNGNRGGYSDSYKGGYYDKEKDTYSKGDQPKNFGRGRGRGNPLNDAKTTI